jgi:hypothetical protein
MQNPKIKLDQGCWYFVASKAFIHKTKSAYSMLLGTIPKGAPVMFLEYHPGSTRSCKVIYQDMVGWIKVDSKYKNHTHFFRKAKMDV